MNGRESQDGQEDASHPDCVTKPVGQGELVLLRTDAWASPRDAGCRFHRAWALAV